MVKIAVTGASGALGSIAIKELVSKVGSDVVALARSPAKAEGLGVPVRHADYDKPDTLSSALEGVETLFFISSPDVGSRVRQHTAVLNAAKAAGIKYVVYTSGLKTSTSKVEPLAQEDRETEALLKQSGIPYTILRNGWYSENRLQALEDVIAAGTLVGCAGPSAKFSCAPRADYAAAAVKVLLSPHGTYHGQTLELAGDPETSYTLPELASEVSRMTGKEILYQDIPLESYVQILKTTGLPPTTAKAYALFDVDAAEGGLFYDGRELSNLIGRPTAKITDLLPAYLPTLSSST